MLFWKNSRIAMLFLVLLFSTNIVFAENLQVHKMSYAQIGRYVCESDSPLDNAQFQSIVNALKSSQTKLYPYFDKWGSLNEETPTSPDEFKGKISFDNESTMYVILYKDYWIITYDFIFDSETPYTTYLDIIKKQAVNAESIRPAISRANCEEKLMLLVYNIYNYTGGFGCDIKDYEDCKNSQPYLTFIKNFNFPSKAEILHLQKDDSVVIVNKGHLGTDLSSGLGREIVVSPANLFAYGRPNAQWQKHSQFLLKLYSIPYHREQLRMLNDETIKHLSEVDSLAQEMQNAIVDENYGDIQRYAKTLTTLRTNHGTHQEMFNAQRNFTQNFELDNLNINQFYILYYQSLSQRQLTQIKQMLLLNKERIDSSNLKLENLGNAIADIKNLDKISKTVWLMVITVLLMIATLGATIYSARKTIVLQHETVKLESNNVHLQEQNIKEQKEKELGIQEDIIQSISILIKVIENNIKGHKDELNEVPPRVPTYFISQIPVDLYITQLQSQLNEVKTKELKEHILFAQNKIETINRVVTLAQEAVIHDKGRAFNRLVRELKKEEFNYYTSLESEIENIKKLLAKLKTKD